jgi:hypothetical protein
MTTYRIKSIKTIKTAFAQPLSPEVAKEWAGKGMFQSPNITEEMPFKHTKGDYNKILEETGAGALFGTDLPKLRKLYLPQKEHIVTIDGKDYFFTHKEESKNVGAGKNKQWVDGIIEVFGPITYKQNWAIDWKQTPTTPIELSYDKYHEQLQRSPKLVKEKLDLLNEFVADQNEFIDKAAKKDKTFGTVTVLPLQLDRAKRWIDKRLKELENIQKSVEKSVDKSESKTDKAMKDLGSLREEVMTGKTQTSPANYAISVLETKFHSIPTLEELKNELTTINPPFDPQVSAVIKNYLVKVVEWQIKKRTDEKAKKGEEVIDRKERIEADLPEMKELLLKKIKPVEALKGKYDKAQGYYSPEGIKGQATNIEESTSIDYDELVRVKSSLDGALQAIIDLPSKSNEYLMQGGGIRLSQIQSFIDASKIFLKRYKEAAFIPDPVDPESVSINPKLFSNNLGTMGNALVAVVLNQVILSVTNELNRIRGGSVTTESPVPATKQETPANLEPVANVKNKIKRMAELLWVAFEERMKLK